jgi:GTP cyclohydrolase II
MGLACYADITPWRACTLDAAPPYFDESIALVIGDLGTIAGDYANPPLIQFYDECLPAQIIDSVDCSCGAFLASSRERIIASGAGILFALKGGCIFRTPNHNQEKPPFRMDRYLPPARFLIEAGIGRVQAMTSALVKVRALQTYGIEVIPVNT